MATDDYLTVAQIAALMNAGVSTVYRLIYAGDLPTVDVSVQHTKAQSKGKQPRARLRVRRSKFEAFMSSRELAA